MKKKFFKQLTFLNLLLALQNSMESTGILKINNSIDNLTDKSLNDLSLEYQNLKSDKSLESLSREYQNNKFNINSHPQYLPFVIQELIIKNDSNKESLNDLKNDLDYNKSNESLVQKTLKITMEAISIQGSIKKLKSFLLEKNLSKPLILDYEIYNPKVNELNKNYNTLFNIMSYLDVKAEDIYIKDQDSLVQNLIDYNFDLTDSETNIKQIQQKINYLEKIQSKNDELILLLSYKNIIKHENNKLNNKFNIQSNPKYLPFAIQDLLREHENNMESLQTRLIPYIPESTLSELSQQTLKITRETLWIEASINKLILLEKDLSEPSILDYQIYDPIFQDDNHKTLKKIMSYLEVKNVISDDSLVKNHNELNEKIQYLSKKQWDNNRKFWALFFNNTIRTIE
jgi:hypothetical protein